MSESKRKIGYKFKKGNTYGFKKGEGLGDDNASRTSEVREKLITLCRSCHAKTNTNRNKWEEFFNENRK